MARLAEDLARLREDLRRMSEHLGEEGAARLGQAKAAVEARLQQLEEALEELRRQARERGQRAAAGLEETVREQPLLALLAAFGLGMVIGRLFGR